jgi:hypothetical protein
MPTRTPITLKQDTLYVAYAPELDLCSYGACQDEALNNLTDEIRQQQEVGEGTGYEEDQPRGVRPSLQNS